MKESDARQKWCPFVRSPVWESESDPPVAGNRIFGGAGYDSNMLCLGSDCAMWESWEANVTSDFDHLPMTINQGEGDCGLKRRGE